MLENYFKTAWRNLLRNKTFSVIKILGLSIGLTVCMLIFLYTKDEVSYDRFHENKSNLFRITQSFNFGNQPEQTFGITNGIVGESFAKELPEVEQFVRITGAPVTVKKGKDVYTENPLFADDNYFSIFSFRLLGGAKASALKDIHSIVISDQMAKKYFGSRDVIGKVMQIKLADDFENFIVSAVAEKAPQNSTLSTDMVIPYKYYDKYNSNQGWFGGSLNTFLLLSPRANVKAVEAKMQSIFDKNVKDIIAQREKDQNMKIRIQLGLQPLTDIHLGNPAGPDHGMTGGSNPIYSYILTCIAIFILIIACINFINLAIAQSLKRSKEIGIRKVIGGTRQQLIKQFLTESFLISLVAFVIAIALTSVLLPFFSELANKKLSLAYLLDGTLFLAYFLLLLVTSFVAGFYPSLVLSAFQPVKVLYNKQKLSGKNYLTKGLTVVQFTLAIILIIGTLAIYSQLRFLLNQDMGYDNKGLVRIDIPISNSSDALPALFKNELLHNPDIIDVAAKNGGRSIASARVNENTFQIENCRIDENFLPAFKIPILAGRNFSKDYPSDSTSSVLVNESFVKAAGWNVKDAIGKTITYGRGDNAVMIAGVIKDYHFASLKEKITPEVLSMNPKFNYGEIWVKVNPQRIPEALALLQATYKKLVPDFPYSYQFMDELNAKNYETESKWKQIISIAAGLFIFVACTGLLGLVILSIQQRTKEIGIRKVLGAAVSRIVFIVSKEFIVLILISFLIASPFAYYAIYKWLQEFAYRIDISVWMFAAAGMLMILVAAITIAFHAIKAAVANPVKSLRTE